MAALFDAKHGSKVTWKGVLIIWMIYLPIIRSTHIEVDSDGGYQKIVIAVSKRTLETISDLSELESNLTNFFSNVSEKLYRATRNRVFFKEIRVLLPYSIDSKIDDSKVNIGNSTFESYQEADIRFDTFNPVPDRGDLYTNQPRGCGKRGDFIYLNPDYIKDGISELNDVKVHRFVQEWSKFRYGVFEENGDGIGIFPSNYTYKNGTTERTGCSASDNSFISIMDDEKLQGKVFCGKAEHNNIAPNRHNAFCKNNSTWSVISKNVDFAKLKSKTDNSGITTIKPIPELKINFVKLLANVIIVIDSIICKADDGNKTVSTKGSHMLNLALRKFIQDSPDYVQIGIIVAVTHPKKTNMARDSTSLVKEFHGIIDQQNGSLDTRNLNAGIKAGHESLKQLSGNGYLVVITSEKELQNWIASSQASLQENTENLFLLTWSEKTKISWSEDNLKQMKNFVNYPTRNLWMNIKLQNSIGECDVNARLQIEDASHQFYTRYLLDDFYSAKAKIGNYEMKPDEAHQFTLPLPNAGVVFNIYGCKYENDENTATLTVNGNRETIKTENLDKYIAFSHEWEHPTNTNSEISFEAQVSQSKSLGSSVWIEIPVGTTNFTAIDMKFERKDDDNSPVIFYAFNPSDLKLEAQITSQSGENISLKFDNNGNGDPDIIADDKIYSHYFISSEITDGVYAIKTIAKDADDNIIDQRTLGYFPLKSQKIDQFPPSRIVNLHLKNVDISTPAATLAWAAPGNYYDTGSAKTYRIICKTNFDEIKIETVPTLDENKKIELIPVTPKPAGSNEQYIWPIPQRETVYFCTIASTNNNNKNSEWSNVITIYVKELPTTTTKPTTSTTPAPPVTSGERSSSSLISSVPSSIASSSDTPPSEALTTEDSSANRTFDSNNIADIALSEKSALGTGEIAGIAIGILIFIILLIALAIFLFRLQKRRKTNKGPTYQTRVAPASTPNNRVSMAESNGSGPDGDVQNKPPISNQRNVLGLKSSTKNADYEKRISHLQDDDDSVPAYATSQFVQQGNVNMNLQEDDEDCAYAVSSYIPPTKNTIFPIPSNQHQEEEVVAYASSPFVPQQPMASINQKKMPINEDVVYSEIDYSKKTPKNAPPQEQPEGPNLNAIYSTVDISKKTPKTGPPNGNPQEQGIGLNAIYSTVDESKKSAKDVQPNATLQEGAATGGVNPEAIYSEVDKSKKTKLPIPIPRGQGKAKTVTPV